MATYQTNYSEKPLVGVAGQLADTALSNVISRTVESAAGIGFGAPAYRGAAGGGVVASGVFAATAVSSKYHGSGASSVITAAPTVSAGAKQGRYVITIAKEGNNETFYLEDPEGQTIDQGTVGSNYSANGLAFSIATSTTRSIGDIFHIDVTFTANADFTGLAIMTPAVAGGTSPDQYKQYFTGGFMTLGQMFVLAGGTVKAGQKVYWNHANQDYSAHNTHILIPGAVFETAGVDNDIVTIALNPR